jgi:peptidyl-prolyl cis-trans isomerase C
VASNFAFQGMTPDPEAQGNTVAERFYYMAVDRLVEQTLLMQEARKESLDVTDDEVQASISQLMVMAGGEAAFQGILTERGITAEDVERDMRTNLILRKHFDRILAEAPQIQTSDLQAYYDANPDQFKAHPEVHARHILFMLEPGIDDMTRVQVRARAEAVLKKVRAGEDFAALAREHSEDKTTAPSGGDLSWFGPGQMVPAFDSAAFALKPGSISDLVETQFGYHIIKVEESRMSQPLAFEQVQEGIRSQLQQIRGQDLYRTSVDALLQNSQVEISPPNPEDLETIQPQG